MLIPGILHDEQKLMNRITFKINDKEFSVPKAFLNSNILTIKSVPKSYSVTWEDQKHPFEIINDLMSENQNNILFIDKNVYKTYGKYLKADPSKIFIAKASENFKTLKGLMKLIDFLQENKFTKGEKLIVVGGGVIQDVGAFAGACYKRGIPWIYFPTTLLAMCDSCIGSKAGINYQHVKNQLAIFSAPSQVVISPVFLKSLPVREIKAGLGEILKLHIIGGKYSLESFKEHISRAIKLDYTAFKPLIFGSLHIKKSVIEEDEFELNYRKALNYGHTIGHAMEILSDYRIPHGQAVVIGMIVANELSRHRNMLNAEENKSLKALSYDLLDQDSLHGLSTSNLGDLLQKDKKTSGSLITFILLESIGEIRLIPMHLNSKLIDEISEILTEYVHRF